MNTTAVVAVATKDQTNRSKSRTEETQVQYICNLFELSKKFDTSTGMEPLLIKRTNVRIKDGVSDILEMRGYFSKETVENAIFKLKDSGSMNREAIIELVTEQNADQSIVKCIKFMFPKFRVRT